MPESNLTSYNSKYYEKMSKLIESNPDYFDHIAGRCLCYMCDCGKCENKCKLMNNKVDSSQKIKWISSYKKDFSDYSQTPSAKDSNIKDRNSKLSIFSCISNPKDYVSIMKSDFKAPDNNY